MNRPNALEAYERERDLVQARWQGELNSEISFWDGWIASNWGGTDDWQRLLDPTRELESRFTDLINAPPGATVKVLDVGAGPLCALGPRWDGRKLVVSAVDPLADEYRAFLQAKGVVPPNWTERGDAEQLSTLFQENEFDLAHASNCLDHSYDPLKAFREIATVIKPGCTAVLEHASNEAVTEKYTGLHQWNFDLRNGDFILWRPGVELSVQEALADIAAVSYFVRDLGPGRRWISVRLRKLRPGESVAIARSGEISQPLPPPLRHVIADGISEALKRSPSIHGALRRIAATLLRRP